MNLIQRLIDQTTATSFRANCPYCGGNNSLSVNKIDGEYKYKCFKAHCTIAGNYHTGFTINEIKQKISKVVEHKSFALPEHFVKGIANDLVYGYLRDNACLPAVLAGKAKIAYDPKENRAVFLIYNGIEIKGAVGRALNSHVKPKSKIYQGSLTYPFICGHADTLVVVEDCASACAVTRVPNVAGLALLGTYMKPEYVPVIAKYKNVIIALDSDANAKALTVNKLIKYYTNSKVVLLPKDIKNMTQEEVECLRLNEGP